MDRLSPPYINAVRYLYDRINYEKTTDRPYDQRAYRLARMEHVLKLLGNPHLAAPVIHIAGTKGKGSVSWLIAEMLRRSGKRVGLYTSPHLMFLEERFVVDGVACTPEEVVENVDKIRHAAEETSASSHGAPTFFEMTTALAWTLFASRRTEVNVIEVGLGGRLDSTNVCNSSLAIITSISFDHQQQLGDTIALIAAEKAGIIKRNVPVISGATHPEAQAIVSARCRELQSPLWQLGVDFHSNVKIQPTSAGRLDSVSSFPRESRLSFESGNSNASIHPLNDLRVGMIGQHQAVNAAIAIAASQRLNLDGWQLPEEAMVDAVASSQLCCRLEIVSEHPTTIVDTSHNVASIAALLDSLKHYFAPGKRTLIFACSKDKEYEKMLDQVMSEVDRLIVTQFQSNPRTVPVERLEELAKARAGKYPNVQVLSSPSAALALQHATDSAEKDELICITGSFFLAAEIRPLFPPHHSLRKDRIHAY